MSNFDNKPNTDKVVGQRGEFVIFECGASGKRVKATDQEWGCFKVGDTGTIVGADVDGDIAVKFDETGQIWFVTGNMDSVRDGEHMIELIEGQND